MTLAFSLPPQADSPLGRLDPRWRLAGLIVVAAAVSLLHSLPAAGVALLVAMLLAASARLPARWCLERLGAVAFFLALFTLPLPFLIDGEGPAVEWGPLRLTWAGTRAGLLLAARALTILLVMLSLLAAAPLDATLKAARSLRVPGLFVQLALLTYRYIFVLAGELSRLRIALRVRGFRNRATRHSYRTVGNLAGVLLVRGFERAERVGQAMRCRGFYGHFRTLTEFRTRPIDIVAFLLLAATAVGLWLLDRLCRG
jgi:cobalt/nickel transport system permease protein